MLVEVAAPAGGVAFAQVDDGDASLVAGYRWRLSEWGYVVAANTRPKVRMHRLILGLEKGEARQVDHVNLDKLDNRRDNLRLATPGENMQNLPSYRGASSRYRGVSRKGGKWVARTRLNGTLHHLGTFADEGEAAAVAAEFRRQHMPFSAEAMA